MKRRTFLSTALGTTAGFLSGVWAGRSILPLGRRGLASVGAATNQNSGFLVVMEISGGADSVLGLEPKKYSRSLLERDIWLGYREQDILMPLPGIFLGPAAAPIARYASRMAIINGIVMNDVDVGHDAALRLALTGLESSYSLGSEHVAIQPPDHWPKGLLTVGVSMNSVDTHPRATLTSVTLNPGNRDFPLNSASQLGALPVGSAINQSDLDRSFLRMNQARGLLVSGTQIFDQCILNGRNALSSLAAASFGAGIAGGLHARLPFSPVAGYLDSHEGHPQVHLPAQLGCWNDVADLLLALEQTPHQQGSLLDATTVVVLSEFSRTPTLNERQGKDHNPLTNSIALFGRGVKGGTRIGESTVISAARSQTQNALLMGTPYNFGATQGLIRPKHVTRTIAHLLGDEAGFDALMRSSETLASPIPILREIVAPLV